MPEPFVFEAAARNRRTALAMLAVWIALGAAWLWLDAALWLIAFVAAFTLPALYDLARNPSSGLRLGDGRLEWHSGRRQAALEVSEIDHVRLDTRLDFTVRATAVLTTDRKVRLPFESTPPHRDFEAALENHGVATRRTHFQLMQ